MKIYVSGSHSSGKTTLCREIGRRYGYVIVEEAARSVVDDQKIDFTKFIRDAQAADRFQHDVADLHIKEAALGQLRGNTVFDRSVDFIVYASMFSTVCAKQMEQLDSYVKILKSPDARVLVLDPHEELIRDDGVRKAMGMDVAWSITNGIILVLEMHNIPYIRLTSPNLVDRIKVVDALIKWENKT